MAADPRIWLDRQASRLEMERRVMEAVLASGAEAPRHPNDPRGPADASPRDLRGIPAVGRGVSGAIRGSRPEHDAQL